MNISFGTNSFMDRILWGNAVSEYMFSVLIFIVLMAALWGLNLLVTKILKNITKKTDTTFDDFVVSILEKAVLPAMYVGAFFPATHRLAMADGAKLFINKTTLVVMTYFVIKAAIMLIDYVVLEILDKHEDDEGRMKSIKGLMVIVKGTIWMIGLLVMLDNLGYKVSTILAGLGIGGVAVALAAQAILGDLFSYVSIILDKPFITGDFIVVDDNMGTVENIGIKTTRIRSLSGEEIIFSNSNLTSSR
ncbi:MAG: mechanosensitive ion channel family protein, partial [Spirochaetia bacterium]|nr:mechanosensitive ion channel family protein [Spirochaetia bacterium]